MTKVLLKSIKNNFCPETGTSYAEKGHQVKLKVATGLMYLKQCQAKDHTKETSQEAFRSSQTLDDPTWTTLASILEIRTLCLGCPHSGISLWYCQKATCLSLAYPLICHKSFSLIHSTCAHDEMSLTDLYIKNK